MPWRTKVSGARPVEHRTRAAVEAWEAEVAHAVAHGESVDAVAEAAGVTTREVRAIIGRRS